MTELEKPLVVSLGDPAGIGPDIILAAFSEREQRALPPFYVQGCLRVLRERAEALGLKIDIEDIGSANSQAVLDTFSSSLPVVQSLPLGNVCAGKLSQQHGPFVIEAIKRSVQDIFEGTASGLVTAPLHKGSLYGSGFKFPGHTEYLGFLTNEFYKVKCQPVMMLASDELRVVPVTIHVPLADVPSLLTKKLICTTVEILSKDLTDRFGLLKPNIILTGLNPHAGEDGTIGRTEIEVIEPAVQELCSSGLNVTGPFSADTCFHPRARAQYDAAVTMYHDQGLIPIKTLSFDDGVNVTLGLPFIRTSPDHGTALEIAGTGQARSDSFIAALKMAAEMSINSTNAGNG
ncbi:MAG: 4-hydroxythreonine-4-phosphate dehydrogenase PdxA [Hyphomicrobiales bacterium]